MAKRPESNPSHQSRSPKAPQGSRHRDVPGAKNPYIRTRQPNKPKLEPHLTTLWSYPSQHYGNREQGSQGYKGATPSWVIWEVIQRFTKPGDVVVDPFCGSGTTLDVCRDTDRKGRGFDIAPYRDDVEAADARELPLAPKSASLVFMDPPYADNLSYSDSPACIGKTKAHDGSYESAMAAVLEEAARVVRPGGALAIYVQDIWHEKEKRFFPLGIMLANLAASHFQLVDHVSVVRNNEKLSRGSHRSAAQERGFMMRGFNHLLLFRLQSRTQSRSQPRSQSRSQAPSTRPQKESSGRSTKHPAKKTSSRNHGDRSQDTRSESRTERKPSRNSADEVNASPKKRGGLPNAFRNPKKKKNVGKKPKKKIGTEPAGGGSKNAPGQKRSTTPKKDR